MPEHNPGQLGGTMRLGKRRTNFKKKDSVLSMRQTLFETTVTIFYSFKLTLRIYYSQKQLAFWNTISSF